jgi:hypothetical protein
VTVDAQSVIQSFERLSEIDKKEVALEIVRRSLKFDLPPLTDKELVLNAEEIFLELDKREATDG